MQDEHLDSALAEEFAGHGEAIHKLKLSNPHFKSLMQQNHALWLEIKNMQADVTPTTDEVRHELERRRLKLLDEIGAIIRRTGA